MTKKELQQIIKETVKAQLTEGTQVLNDEYTWGYLYDILIDVEIEGKKSVITYTLVTKRTQKKLAQFKSSIPSVDIQKLENLTLYNSVLITAMKKGIEDFETKTIENKSVADLKSIVNVFNSELIKRVNIPNAI